MCRYPVQDTPDGQAAWIVRVPNASIVRQQTPGALPEPARIPEGVPVSRGFDRVCPSESLSELLPTPGQSTRITQSELMKLAAKSLAVTNRTTMTQAWNAAHLHSPPRQDVLHGVPGPVPPEAAVRDVSSSGGTAGGVSARLSGECKSAECINAALADGDEGAADDVRHEGAACDLRAGEGENTEEPSGVLPSPWVFGSDREEARTGGASTVVPIGGGPVQTGDNPTHLRRRLSSRPQVVGSLQTIEEAGSYESEDLGC
jgi:hypothetical protein